MTKIHNKLSKSLFFNNLIFVKKEEKFTAKHLSSITGITYDTLIRLLNGENEAKLENAITIATAIEKHYGYNPAWLVMGLGDPKTKVVSEEISLPLIKKIIEGVFWKYTAVRGDEAPVTPGEFDDFSEILAQRYNEYNERAKKRIESRKLKSEKVS